MSLKRLSAVLLFIVLGACKSLPQRTQADVAELTLAQRSAQLNECRDFRLSGKLAISQVTANGSDGGSGRFQWQQTGEVIEFRLSAPLSNQTWQLQGLPGAYALTDSKGQVMRNASAEQLIQDASGWTLPVTQLRSWVLGLPTNSALQSAQTRYQDGTLKQFSERGWQVDYLSYTKTEPRLPIKIKAVLKTADKSKASVKIIVQDWRGCGSEK